MNKAYLIALREFMENLRTKAFWIGILAFPVIIVLVFVPVFAIPGLGRWPAGLALEAVDVVLHVSGWLSSVPGATWPTPSSSVRSGAT